MEDSSQDCSSHKIIPKQILLGYPVSNFTQNSQVAFIIQKDLGNPWKNWPLNALSEILYKRNMFGCHIWAKFVTLPYMDSIV